VIFDREDLAAFLCANRGAHAQIDNECPESTRVGLLHIVLNAVGQHYVEDHQTVVRELERIARVRPDAFSDIDGLLMQLPWDKVFDFCERSTITWRRTINDMMVSLRRWCKLRRKARPNDTSLAKLQRLFLEENLAFEFSDGIVRRRGRRNTADQVSRAEVVLGDPRLAKALGHFNKALRYFRNISQPDPRTL